MFFFQYFMCQNSILRSQEFKENIPLNLKDHEVI